MRPARRHRSKLLIVIGVIASICVAVVVTKPRATSRSPHKSVRLAAAPAAPRATAPTSAQLHAAAAVFGVFNHSRKAGDSLPAGSAYADGVSRRIGSSSDLLRAWAVSTNDQVCVTLHAPKGPAGPAACNTVAELRNPNQLLVDVSTSSDSSSEVIAGVAPTGVSSIKIEFSDGTSATVPVVNNGFTYTASKSQKIGELTWSDAGVTNIEKAR